MSGRDLGHFGCDGRYRLPRDFNTSDFVEFVMDGVKGASMPPRCEYVQRGLQCNFNKGHDGSCIFVVKGAPDLSAIYDTSCRIPMPIHVTENVDDHTLESCRAKFPDTRNFGGASFPPQPPNLGVASARDVLREQSELISKYAAHCESKAQVCSSVATLLEYTERAKLARSIALIYFRSATLEV